jgi:hypothetical protein
MISLGNVQRALRLDVVSAVRTSEFLRYGVGRILFTGIKDVFKRTAVLGRASVSKQFDGHGWNRQKEGNQDGCEAGHRLGGYAMRSIASECIDSLSTFKQQVDLIT